jgi:DsbC/DsbD-like thiol-disulfide interchange protein
MRVAIIVAVAVLVAAGGMTPAAIAPDAGGGRHDMRVSVPPGSAGAHRQESDAVSGFLRTLEPQPAGGGPSARVEARHLTAIVSVRDPHVAPGGRFSVIFDVQPKPGIHVYARGNHDYRPFAPLFDPQPALVLQDTTWPAPGEYYFAPLDERVPAYSQPFRVVQPMMLRLAEGSALLEKASTLAIAGTISYQACDDKICYLPDQVPFKVSIGLRAAPPSTPPPPKAAR